MQFDSSSEPLLNVVLVEPEIPPNTGNVGRLCMATSARLHLVEPLGFNLDDKQLRRAGMDYWDQLDVKVWPSFEVLGSEDGNDSVFWFFTTKAQIPFWDVTFSPGDYLVFGRETKGLPETLLKKHESNCLRIPITEGARSLNLATAVGIGVYGALHSFM
ncbi:MAG: tRNA (cytidine(34)-2'-O)-methyltransferase [Verrucomicrobiales bacterium]|nr:tRNA (cytidine(34)-2'-O)-methyltransferase [Verrucomicrobiales bacterium]